MAARRRTEAGYSLVELIVALAIIAGLSLSLAEALRFSAQTMSRAATLREGAGEMLVARRVLGEWFGAAQAHPDADGRAIDFIGDAERVQFRTLAPAFPTARGFYEITLEIKRARGGGRRLQIYRRAEGAKEAPYESTLFDGAESLDFSYLAPDGGFRAQWSNASAPPRLVKLTVDGRSLTFPVPSRISSACLSSRGGREISVREPCA